VFYTPLHLDSAVTVHRFAYFVAILAAITPLIAENLIDLSVRVRVDQSESADSSGHSDTNEYRSRGFSFGDALYSVQTLEYQLHPKASRRGILRERTTTSLPCGTLVHQVV